MKNLFALAVLMAGLCALGIAQNRPLETESAETVEKGALRFELGSAYLHQVRYTTSGLEGNLFRLGDLGLHWGAGDTVEVQLFWTAQNLLSITRRWEGPLSERIEFSGNSTNDVGDLQVATKIRFIEQNESRPGFGFRFGTELPNASQESGLGADEINFHFTFLLEKDFAAWKLLGNLGLSILGDPTNVAAQNDLYHYGIAALYSVAPRLRILGDFYGRVGQGGIGTEERSRLRIGSQIRAAGFYWDAGLLLGFQDTDPDFGIIFGLSKDFHL